MNKKFIFSLVCLSFLFVSPQFVHAKSGEGLINYLGKYRANQEKSVEKLEEVKDMREGKRSEHAKRHADRLETNFAKYYDRLVKIAEKIQKRIDEETKKDTTKAKIKLAEAKSQIETAKTLGANAISLFRAIEKEEWETQIQKAKAARDAAQKARLDFVEAHKQLNEAHKLLKSASTK